MVRSLIVGDATFAVVLSAWWQLRRSAHLLPHLRRGPSSFYFNPGNGFVSWIMAITVQPLLTIHRLQRPTRRGAPGRPGPQQPNPKEVGAQEVGAATTPIPIPAELRPARASEPPTCPLPVVRQATVSIPSKAGPPPPENGAGYLEPPTRPSIARRGAR